LILQVSILSELSYNFNVVIEVGLGGADDATNVISPVMLSDVLLATLHFQYQALY
jgi:hypothetical protein